MSDELKYTNYNLTDGITNNTQFSTMIVQREAYCNNTVVCDETDTYIKHIIDDTDLVKEHMEYFSVSYPAQLSASLPSAATAADSGSGTWGWVGEVQNSPLREAGGYVSH